jgi:hypothetical protein
VESTAEASSEPPVWTEQQLERDRQRSIQAFIAGRTAAAGALARETYRTVLAVSIDQVRALLAATDDLLTFASGDLLVRQPGWLELARYLAGPPISAADLNTLASERLAGRKRLSPAQARTAARLLLDALDATRFPWLAATPPRRPTDQEREIAVYWTAGLKTVQEIQTSQRGTAASDQEQAVAAVLEAAGYQLTTLQALQTIETMPVGTYVRETLIRGKKADIAVRLHDGRLLLIECKVSNSTVNSIKRLRHETGNKATAWRGLHGRIIVAAVLAGVYTLPHLSAAQSEDQLTLFWQHDLRPLAGMLTGGE